MNKQIDAIKKALEVLEDHVTRFDAEQFTSVCELDPAKDAIIALREALAEQPVATLYGSLPVYDKPAQQDLPDLIAGALGVSRGTAYDMMREALTEQSVQQTCNCRWEGEVQVQQCTLHEAHIDAIHEWAGRAKAAEAKLAEQPAQPLTPEWYARWIRNNYQDHPNIATLCDEMTKAAHGITKGNT